MSFIFALSALSRWSDVSIFKIYYIDEYKAKKLQFLSRQTIRTVHLVAIRVIYFLSKLVKFKAKK